MNTPQPVDAAPRPGNTARVIAAVALGLALGSTASAGNALLLYTGQGFLRAAGLLFSSTMMALAAGVWAGAPEHENAAPPPSRARWVALVVTLLLAGGFTVYWIGREEMRALAVGGAIAVLLIVAVPAYTAGAVLAALHARQPAATGGVAAGALAGAALGVLLATTVMIQNLEPYGIYYAAAALVAAVGITETRLRTHTAHGAGNMEGRVAIITGVGDRGQLGFALAHEFLQAGASVVITGRSEHVNILATELQPAARVAAVSADLTVDDDVARVTGTALERFGRIDALINVAGGLSVTGTISETTPEQWQREISRNAETALRMCRAALPALRERRGAIVNFAAPAGERAVPGLGAYSAAKAAVIALTRSLALEERTTGVRVNAIAPGTMDTEQNRAAVADHEHAVFVRREDVARLALFLAGPDGAAINGETVHAVGRTLR